MSMQILLTRTTGGFGLSIGTSLAIESIFGLQEDSYDKTRTFNRVDINSYSFYYFNIYTLVRNIYTALESKKLNVLLDRNGHERDVIQVVLSEVAILEQLFRNLNCKLVYFLPDYSKVSNKVFMNALKKLSKKDKMHINTINMIGKITDLLEKENVNFLSDTHKLEKTKDKVLITTHISPDLLCYKFVPNLELLESHTGVVKTRKEWNTKYPRSTALGRDRLPFNEILLRLIGDNLIFPKPMSDYKSEITAISEKYKWTPLTTEEKVIANLKSNTDIRNDLNAILQYGLKYK